jgi:catechol 2,3-dioxygenase-like lactoylglutathione lyase family enzyme
MNGLDHVGFTVSNLDRALTFYRLLLSSDPVMRSSLTGAFPASVIGYDPIDIELAFFELPNSEVGLELIEYRVPAGQRGLMETYVVGNGHLCLEVDDLDAEYARLEAAGVEVGRAGPVNIPEGIGSYSGGKVVYLRDPDGITIELLQKPEPSTGTNRERG